MKRGRSRSRSPARKRSRTRSPSRRRTKKVSVTRALSSKSFGQPKYKIVSMPYHVCKMLAAGAAGTTSYTQFFINSIFDPDYTSTGHQPLTHDQWALFYNHYVVTNVSATLRFSPNDTLANPCYVGCVLSDDATTAITSGNANLDVACENKYIQYRMFPSGEPIQKVIKYNVKPCSWLGRSPYSNDMKASFGSSPAEAVFLTVFSTPVNGSYSVEPIFVDIMLNFTVMLIEPKELPGS
jgi:hypothetical protein